MGAFSEYTKYSSLSDFGIKHRGDSLKIMGNNYDPRVPFHRAVQRFLSVPH